MENHESPARGCTSCGMQKHRIAMVHHTSKPTINNENPTRFSGDVMRESQMLKGEDRTREPTKICCLGLGTYAAQSFPEPPPPKIRWCRLKKFIDDYPTTFYSIHCTVRLNSCTLIDLVFKLTLLQSFKMGDADVTASSWKHVEVGRVVLFSTGLYAGRIAAIVEIIDHKRVCHTSL